MKILFNDFKKQYQLRKEEFDSAIGRVLESGWYILGKELENFEQEFAEKNGSSYCIWVANGLDALKISLLALWIGEGDEVITTSHSAVATTLAVLDVGATPVFVDIDEYFALDASKIEKAITNKTRAVLPVHLYGQSCDITTIKSICESHHLFLIEDCAQSHFTEFDGKKVGNFGILWCYSFYPTKNLWAFGDAGAIITNDEELAKKCRMIRNYGQENRYEHTVYGINSRLDEIQAAILWVRLRHIDEETLRRREISDLYRIGLSRIKEIILPKISEKGRHTFHLFVIECHDRQGLMDHLESQWIPSLIHYPIPIHRQPLFKGNYDTISLPLLEKKIEVILSLPIHPFLTDEEVFWVIGQIKTFYNEK